MGRKRERRCNLNLEEQEIEREEQTSEWSNQPGGAHHCWWICSKKDYCSSAPQRFLGRLSKRFGRPPKNGHTLHLSFVCPKFKLPPPILFRLDALVCSLQRILQLIYFAISFFLISARTVMGWGGQKREWSLSAPPPPHTPILIPSPLFQNPTAGDHGGPAYMGRV